MVGLEGTIHGPQIDMKRVREAQSGPRCEAKLGNNSCANLQRQDEDASAVDLSVLAKPPCLVSTQSYGTLRPHHLSRGGSLLPFSQGMATAREEKKDVGSDG